MDRTTLADMLGYIFAVASIGFTVWVVLDTLR